MPGLHADNYTQIKKDLGFESFSCPCRVKQTQLSIESYYGTSVIDLHFLSLRIQGSDDKKLVKFYKLKFCYKNLQDTVKYQVFKNLSLGLHEGLLNYRRSLRAPEENPALQTNTFLQFFFSLCCGRIRISGSGSGSSQPKSMWIWIHNSD